MLIWSMRVLSGPFSDYELSLDTSVAKVGRLLEANECVTHTTSIYIPIIVIIAD